MIDFKKRILDNGLTVIVHEDKSTPLVALNVLYKVGARDEDENKTGFAHLFEHLMFGGSVNIPSYDEPLQRAGGENNAFTNNDFTNYYLTIPSQNVETGFWLESDRMLSLAFSEKSLEVQRSVVIEEFKQRYLNQPYGDVWLYLRPLAYKKHPYKWATIGKEISHIENATLEDVKNFFHKYYLPNNAILSIAGDIEPEKAFALAEKWFAKIPSSTLDKNGYVKEGKQTEERFLTLERPVPLNSVYKAYHTVARGNENFHTTEVIADALSGSKSSRLYQALVKEQKIFADLHAYFLGDLDESLIVIEGKVLPEHTIEQANTAIEVELKKITETLMSEHELDKVKNKIESALVFGEMNIGNKALNLAYFEMLGDAAMINTQKKEYEKINPYQVQKIAADIFRKENCSTIFYKAAAN
ncbi:MAG TPA: pitrilysin family protein [Bacteroidia bacterium]|nr:pitrilysin family protein [Bacteroidia bacterium]HNU33550.1 pitrilysin family protein [Bacteroidia bacterium]